MLPLFTVGFQRPTRRGHCRVVTTVENHDIGAQYTRTENPLQAGAIGSTASVRSRRASLPVHMPVSRGEVE